MTRRSGRRTNICETMKPLRATYSQRFYAIQQRGSSRSAQKVLPLAFAAVKPQSVVDIGCGIGTWLATARDLGARRAVGLEGPWVTTAALADGSLEILPTDLEQPFALGERFDLAVCMEVAEHLSPARAESFVGDLCRLAPHVLFSAAVPGQGGTNHVNEQWQSYWASLFAKQGFGARDIIRPALWHDRAVEYWYRQNAVLYSAGAGAAADSGFDKVHPVHNSIAKRVGRVVMKVIDATA